MKILIVDDDPQVVTYIMERLERWGYDFQSAGTGSDALKLFSKHTFDLILLDIMLPDYLGYNLIPEFKQIDPGIEIITMTGESSRELEQRVRKEGILYYMVKPIETDNLKLLLDHRRQKG